MFVAIESLINSIPLEIATCSSLCSRPLKFFITLITVFVWACAVSIRITSAPESMSFCVLLLVSFEIPTAAPTLNLSYSSLQELGYKSDFKISFTVIKPFKLKLLSVTNNSGFKSLSEIEQLNYERKVEQIKKEDSIKKILDIIPSSEVTSVKEIEKENNKNKEK